MNTDKKLCINCKYFLWMSCYQQCSHPNNLDYVSNSPEKLPKYLRSNDGYDTNCGIEGRWFEEKVIVEMPETKKSWFRKLLEGI